MNREDVVRRRHEARAKLAKASATVQDMSAERAHGMAAPSENAPGSGQSDRGDRTPPGGGSTPPDPPTGGGSPPPPASGEDPYADQRVLIYLSSETQNALSALARSQGTTVTEIIRRGIGIIQFLEREMKRGDRLLIEGASGKVRRVLFPWES